MIEEVVGTALVVVGGLVVWQWWARRPSSRLPQPPDPFADRRAMTRYHRALSSVKRR